MPLLPTIDAKRGERLLVEAVLRAGGGPGSGNFGHAGRPGMEGGSSAGAGVDGRSLESIKRSLRTSAAKMGFPTEDLIIETYDRSFNVGGRVFKEGGHYDPSTRKVTLNANSLLKSSPGEREAMLAHEVMHRDWDDVNEALGNPLTGGLPEHDLPESADVISSILTEDGDQLSREDGVSSYSRAYWDAVPKAPKFELSGDPDYKWMNPDTGELFNSDGRDRVEENFPPANYDQLFERAVDETLAEISANEMRRIFRTHAYSSKIEVADPSSRWRRLHKAVKATAKILRGGGFKPVTALGGPGSGNFGHAGRPGQEGGSSSSSTLSQNSFKTETEDTTERVRDGASARLTERVVVDRADLDALAKEEGILIEGRSDRDAVEAVVNMYLRRWAGSSGGPAVEQMARAVVTERLGGQSYIELARTEGARQWMKDNPAPARALSAIGVAMYDSTQAWLQERGVTSVPLLRSGVPGNDRLHTSLSTDWGGVRHESGRKLVSETVPVKYIWSVPSTGFGTMTESEVVVLPRPQSPTRRALGGPGSGNFGHAGRPGQEGGSASDAAMPPPTSAAVEKDILKDFAWRLSPKPDPDSSDDPEDEQEIIRENQKLLARWDVVTPEEYFEKVNENLQDVIPDSKIFIRMNQTDLKLVLASDEIQNAFQSGRTHAGRDVGGGIALGRRRHVEEQLFGVPPSASGAQRPKYGYLSSGNGIAGFGLSGAGKVAIELKDNVADRTTFTVGDSADNAVSLLPEGLGGGWTGGLKFAPQPMKKPSILAIPKGKVNSPVSRVDQLAPRSYVEAQIHGKISVSDIKSISFGERPSPAVVKKLEALGIPYRVFKMKTLSEAVETPLHAIADSYAPKFSLALRYAFALARKTLIATRDETQTITVLRRALLKTLPGLVGKTIGAGGQLTLNDLTLRTAGGPGSGNFGHAGRPGQEGGSVGASWKRYDSATQHKLTLYLSSLPISVESSRPVETLKSTSPQQAVPRELGTLRESVGLYTGAWSKQIGDASRDLITGNKVQPDFAGRYAPKGSFIRFEDAAKDLMHAVDSSPLLDAPIFHGTGDDHFSTLTSGDSITLGLQSFSFDKNVGEHFATTHGKQRGVLLRVDGPARALRMGALSHYPEQQEALTYGRFTITKVVDERIREKAVKVITIQATKLKTLGGPGSGNFGHAGRPGQEGGSDTTSSRETRIAERQKAIQLKLNADEQQASWPISDDVVRQAGTATPLALNKASKEWAGSLTKSERHTIYDYTDESYYSINRKLLTGRSSKEALDITRALEKAPKLPPPDLVWRGVGAAGTASFLSQMKNGAVVTLNGFQSTSIDPKIAANWDADTIFEIKPRMGAYVRAVSFNEREREFLLPHAAKYRVRGVTEVFLGKSRRRVVQLEMLGDS